MTTLQPDGKIKYSSFDHVLLRIKDFVIVGGALWAFFMWTFNFSTLPKRLEAQEIALKEYAKDYSEKNLEATTKFVSIEQSQKYISQRLDTIDKKTDNMDKKIDTLLSRSSHGN